MSLNWTMLLLCCVLVAAVIVQGTESDSELGVSVVNGSYVLNKENFETVLANEKTLIIFVYADWCGHCQAFKPTWQQIAEQVNGDPDSATKAFSALIEDNPAIHNDWDTTSFPTIYYVRNGDHKKYGTERNLEQILDFIKANEEEPVIEIEGSDLEDAVQGSYVAIVGRFLSEEKAAMFEKIAWHMEGSAFYRVTTDIIEDSIVVYSQHEGKPKKRQIKLSDDMAAVKTEIAKARRPFVIPFSKTMHTRVFEIPERTISVLLFHDHNEGHQERLKQFGRVARVYSERYNFVEMKMSVEYVTRFSSYFNLKDSDLPIVYIINTASDDGTISKSKDLTESGIAQLIEDYALGLTATFQGNKSDEPEDELPDDWDKRDIKYLIGENYMDYVLFPDNDVIVMWYKPSCPHCQQLEPIWAELAERYKDHPTLKVAHIKSSNLGTVPDRKNLKIEKVPTILLYKRRASELDQAIEWDGKERSMKDLDEFLFKHVFSEKEEL